jgi:hypothetical protein
MLHVVEGILGIGRGIVGADRGEADAFGHQHPGVAHQPADDRFDIRTVVTNKNNQKVFAFEIIKRV